VTVKRNDDESTALYQAERFHRLGRRHSQANRASRSPRRGLTEFSVGRGRKPCRQTGRVEFTTKTTWTNSSRTIQEDEVITTVTGGGPPHSGTRHRGADDRTSMGSKLPRNRRTGPTPNELTTVGAGRANGRGRICPHVCTPHSGGDFNPLGHRGQSPHIADKQRVEPVKRTQGEPGHHGGG